MRHWIRRVGCPLVLAVTAITGFTLLMLVGAIVKGDRMALPGAIVASSICVLLGIFALLGHDWARWLLFVFALLTAMTCMLFTFVDMGDGNPRLGFTPGLGALTLFYIAVAVGLAWPTG